MKNNLKAIRESKGMSQEYVANTLNISRQAISRWENNHSNPEIENLIALSNLYEVSIDELIKDHTMDNPDTSDCSTTTQNDSQKNDTFDVVIYITLLIVSTFISFIGIIVSPILFIKLRKHKYSKVFSILCIICFLICFFNLCILINNIFFHLGTVTIQ